MTTELHKLALGYAVGEALSEHPYPTDYEAYLVIKKAVEEGREPGHLSVWEPLEDMEWPELFNYINKQARVASGLFEGILGDVKLGLEESGMDKTALGLLDINDVYELGAKKSRAK